MSKFLLYSFLIISLSFCKEPLKLNVLHISFHKGCIKEIEAVAKELSFNITSWFIPDLPAFYLDGKSKGSSLYNIGHDRANDIWNRHKSYFESFDLILTSDTAPLSRVFLQNNSSIPLIIWICNRFDYSDSASLDCSFPDLEYYSLFKEAVQKSNVKIIGYTPFENLYAKIKGIDFGKDVIKPAGFFQSSMNIRSSIPKTIIKKETFFVPPYHNDAVLPKELDQLQISYYRGRYSGKGDLKDFKGIIHIPYAWSNLALFENWEEGLIYFIPTKRFLLELKKSMNFFWSPPFKEEFLEYSEWYNPEYRSFFVYFDSWDDLKEKITKVNYNTVSSKVKKFTEIHKQKTLAQWYNVFNSLKTGDIPLWNEN